jgi:hypothetical protein
MMEKEEEKWCEEHLLKEKAGKDASVHGTG